MRHLLPFLIIASFACSGDPGRYPPGTSGPVGPGTSSPGPGPSDPDGGPPPDDGPDAGFACGGETFTCEFADDTANCCDGTFVECPADFPYYCPANTWCTFDPGLCVDASGCTSQGLPCE